VEHDSEVIADGPCAYHAPGLRPISELYTGHISPTDAEKPPMNRDCTYHLCMVTLFPLAGVSPACKQCSVPSSLSNWLSPRAINQFWFWIAAPSFSLHGALVALHGMSKSRCLEPISVDSLTPRPDFRFRRFR
jgi:hypothetical protein